MVEMRAMDAREVEAHLATRERILLAIRAEVDEHRIEPPHLIAIVANVIGELLPSIRHYGINAGDGIELVVRNVVAGCERTLHDEAKERETPTDAD